MSPRLLSVYLQYVHTHTPICHIYVMQNAPKDSVAPGQDAYVMNKVKLKETECLRLSKCSGTQ